MIAFMLVWSYCEANGLDELTSTAIAYPLALVACFVLEAVIPHELSWNDWRKDYAIDRYPVVTDLVHTTLTAVAVHGTKHICELIFSRFALGNGLADALPFPLQIVAATLVAELGQYWQHRLSHTCSWLWPFHAVHHAVPRLYGLNTGRFHFLNQAFATFMGYPPLYLCGFSGQTIHYYTGFYTIIGLLSHTNINTHCGPLNLVFNTPEMHRWHHSKNIGESNSNYGENLLVFDHLFGTYCGGSFGPTVVGRMRYCDHNKDTKNERGRQRAENIDGVGQQSKPAGATPLLAGGCQIPKHISGQLVVPFAANPLRRRAAASVFADAP
jgi:sterol desaturase/sphingolipid hydroxylase (fatty acid hydroxylase superfamily)